MFIDKTLLILQSWNGNEALVKFKVLMMLSFLMKMYSATAAGHLLLPTLVSSSCFSHYPLAGGEMEP